jgi:EH domain-containing protein 3/EH domain-containing protein 1
MSVRGNPPPPAADAPSTPEELLASVLDDLKKVYKTKIRPLETTYNFEAFHSSPLTARDIDAKPMVLLVGQYSTGKTTFIKHLLGRQYPGAHVGMEPTTDRFVAVMHNKEDRVVPGNAAAVSADLPFGGLQKFGTALLSKFQVSQVDSPLLEKMTLVDTPGILSGDKQRSESRGYDFDSVVAWFAERSDLILLLFDGHKLDISDEFKATISRLKGHEDKVRVVLNKADQVSGQQLLRVYGALMWSLGKVVNTPEVLRVYLGSFWSEPPPVRYEDLRVLLNSEQQDLLRDLEGLPKNAAVRKVNELVKRARIAKVHAFIIGHLKGEMPALFGKQGKQDTLLKNLEGEFVAVQARHGLPAGDFPSIEKYREILATFKFNEFNSLNMRIVAAVDDALSRDFPKIMTQLPQPDNSADLMLTNPTPNPFNTPTSPPPDYDQLTEADRTVYNEEFRRLAVANVSGPGTGKVSGPQARPIMERSNLPIETLSRVWRLADWDADGWLDEAQFAVAMHFCKVAAAGGEVPDRVPSGLIPGRFS